MGQVDLDAVIDVIKGPSGNKPMWSALVFYEAEASIFIETRDRPAGFAHGTPSETVEVDEVYLQTHFGLTNRDIAEIRRFPERWRLRNA
ncbi:hypothetical protein [Halopseudomonas xinjiangensis]|nr:hypothetical protein [Halopseudomonas xinjiangensis]